MKTLIAGSNGMASVVPTHGRGVRDWQRLVPYAAIAWSLVYAALGMYWAVSGRGFPYTPETMSDDMGALLGRFGSGVAWIVVLMAGIPAAAVGAARAVCVVVTQPARLGSHHPGNQMERIVIIGNSGSGKTHVGRRLSNYFDYQLNVDTFYSSNNLVVKKSVSSQERR